MALGSCTVDDIAVSVLATVIGHTALQRRGKRAELRVYAGEQHAFYSPANIRDMWDRILAWFEEPGS